MYDSLNMHSLESSLIDIMRAEQDPMKGEEAAFPFPSTPSGGEGRGGEVSLAVCRQVTAPLLPELCCFSTDRLTSSPAESLILVPPAAC